MKPSLTRKQTEEMLPDYAFGRLSEEDSRLFKQSIHEYPDLVQELNDIKAVFSKVEKMDFNSILENRARNLSVRVQQRRSANSSKNYSFSRIFRFAIPTVGLAVMAFIFFTSDNPFFRSQIDSSAFGEQLQVVHSSDAVSLMSEDMNTITVLSEIRSHQNNSEINISLQDNIALDEMIADNMLPTMETSISNQPTQHDELWNNLTDTEIQDILKDLNYENPTTL